MLLRTVPGKDSTSGVLVVEHFPDLEHFLKLLEMLQALEGLRVNSGISADPPVVTVSSRTEVEDGMETHICRVDGFYPREIDASWMRDGEVWLKKTFHGSVAPNADGTYHYWLSVRIDPKERGRYRCHVEHDGLQEPLDVAIKGERLQGGEGWALWQAGGLCCTINDQPVKTDEGSACCEPREEREELKGRLILQMASFQGPTMNWKRPLMASAFFIGGDTETESLTFGTEAQTKHAVKNAAQ
ncbi:hypothetical protein E2320_022398, partial [Naja naja]